MKRYKKTLSFIFAAFIIMLSVFPVNAISSLEQKVVIDSGAGFIPQKVIEDLKNSNPRAGLITIYGYYEVSEKINEASSYKNQTTLKMGIIPPPPRYVYINSTTVTDAEVLAKDEFKFSVARGEEVTLTQAYEGSLKGTISGIPFNKGAIGAEITIKAVYQKGTKYSGPPQGSIENCREFRMKFYEERGTWKQIKESYSVVTNKLIGSETKTGTYKKPTKFLSYSIDRIVY